MKRKYKKYVSKAFAPFVGLGVGLFAAQVGSCQNQKKESPATITILLKVESIVANPKTSSSVVTVVITNKSDREILLNSFELRSFVGKLQVKDENKVVWEILPWDKKLLINPPSFDDNYNIKIGPNKEVKTEIPCWHILASRPNAYDKAKVLVSYSHQEVLEYGAYDPQKKRFMKVIAKADGKAQMKIDRGN